MQLEKDYNCNITVKSPLFPWVVKHAQWTLNRYLEHSDGRTSYERRWGRKYNHAVCTFGETILFKNPSHNFKASSAWERGIWLGKDTESEEHIVGTKDGVKKCRTIRRLVPSEQHDAELFKSINAKPWDPKGKDARDVDTFVFADRSATSDKPADGQQSGGESGTLPTEAPEEANQEDFVDAPSNQNDTRTTETGEPSTPKLSKRDRDPSDDAAAVSTPSRRIRLSRFNPNARINPGPEIEEVLDTKLQRISCIIDGMNDSLSALISNISVMDVKHKTLDIDIPVCVNKDEEEEKAELIASHPTFWYDTEYPEELLVEGMQQEIQSMKTFDVYEEMLEELLDNVQKAKIIDTRWVHRYKGHGVRSRLVVRGFMQQIEDADETFASTPTLITLKTLLTVAQAKGWSVRTADVSTAFLHATLTEDVYIRPPAEYYPAGGVIWKLKRALYGLKNSPRLWQDHFASVMNEHDFVRTKCDSNLYYHKSLRLYIVCYVDDLLLLGDDDLIVSTLSALNKSLLLRETGKLDEGTSVDFLGRVITKHNGAVTLTMDPKFIDTLLDEMNMKTCKPSPTPGSETLKRATLENEEPVDAETHKLYRRMVGKLLWLTNVRNDIMFAVKELSRGLQQPTFLHMNKLKHLLRYLSGTKTLAETLRPNRQLLLDPSKTAIDINTFVDSDWAGCNATRKSTSGCALFVLGVNLCGISRTQQTIALSSGEAELYAIGLGVSESLYVRTLLLESKLCSKCNITLHTDSTAGKSMASRHGLSRKTKHVQLRFLFVQELVLSGQIRLKKVLGTNNPSDIFTKYVTADTLQRHLPVLGYFSHIS